MVLTTYLVFAPLKEVISRPLGELNYGLLMSLGSRIIALEAMLCSLEQVTSLWPEKLFSKSMIFESTQSRM